MSFVRKALLALGAAVAFSAAATCAPHPVAAKSDPAPTIQALRAMPYYPGTGRIRRTTDLFDTRLALRNVVIEPSDGVDPLHRTKIEDWDVEFGTTVTYVEVDVFLGQDPPRAVLEIQARAAETGRQIQSQQVPLAVLGPGRAGVVRVPYFVYGTGCEKLQLTARILRDGAPASRVSRTIPFTCGE